MTVYILLAWQQLSHFFLGIYTTPDQAMEYGRWWASFYKDWEFEKNELGNWVAILNPANPGYGERLTIIPYILDSNEHITAELHAMIHKIDLPQTDPNSIASFDFSDLDE